MSDLEAKPHIVKDMPQGEPINYAPYANSQQQNPASPLIYTNEPVTNYQMPYATAQPIENGYAIRGITVPHDGRQPIFDDEMLVQVMPQARANQVIIVNPTGSVPTVCTSRNPQLFFCVEDNKPFVSQVRYQSSAGEWICWILLFILLFPFSLFFLCCIPVGSSAAVHYCPQCGREVGRVPTML